MKKFKILIFAEDRRSVAAAEYFRKDGHSVFSENGDRSLYNNIDLILLPVPSFTDGLINCSDRIPAEQMFGALKSGTTVCGAVIPQFIFRQAAEYNVSVIDITLREDFCIYNAVPTAEGALHCAMSHLDKTVLGSDFAILGYGKIGKALAKLLTALGSNVTVAARSLSSLANAECDGCTAIEIGEFLNMPYNGDILFNTVPCPIIPFDFYKESNCHTFIELASLPGGFTAECYGIPDKSIITASGLPGKYSPQTAGEIIYKTVNKIVTEIGG